MLEYLRNAADKPVAKILMGLLVFSFVGWGVADWIFGDGGSDDALLRAGGHPLSYQTFENERGRVLGSLSRAEQKQIYATPATQQQFSEQILSGLTSRMLLEVRAEDLGFYVSNAAVANIIRNTSEFMTGGSFNAGLFDMILSNAGWTETQYANVLRNEIMRDMVISATSLVAPVPEYAVAAAYNARYATRKIEFTTVKYSDFNVAGSPDESKIEEIYSRNPKIIPEFRTVQYVLIPVEKMDTPDSYDAGFVIAQKLEDALIGGTDMESAAKSAKAKFVKLPAFNAQRKNAKGADVNDPVLADEILANVFSMDQGIESEIIETPRGFVILRVEKIDAAHAAPMNDVRGELVKTWKSEEQKKQAYVKANELLSDLRAGQKVKMSAATVTRMDGAAADVLVAAFNNPIGTKTIVPGKNEFYVLNIISETMPKMDAKKFKALKGEVENMMTRTISDDYTNFLTTEYPVKINKRIYNRVFGK